MEWEQSKVKYVPTAVPEQPSMPQTSGANSVSHAAANPIFGNMTKQQAKAELGRRSRIVVSSVKDTVRQGASPSFHVLTEQCIADRTALHRGLDVDWKQLWDAWMQYEKQYGDSFGPGDTLQEAHEEAAVCSDCSPNTMPSCSKATNLIQLAESKLKATGFYAQ